MRFEKRKKAFTIIELLISLAITALLMTAVAVAFNASLTNYQENEEIFRAMNNARQALLRITTQLRTADWVDPNAPSNECSLITATEDITYRYDSGTKTLYLTDNSTASDYVLCDNITAMNFTIETGIEGSAIYAKSIQIAITVGIGNNQQTVSSAAVIRKNLK